MKAADINPTSSKTQRFQSLRGKIYLPFFILIVGLCAAGIWGTFHLADKSFQNSAEQRLQATQEVLFREFKKQETLLQTYTVMMQQFQSLYDRYRKDAEIGILQDRLFNVLEESKINVTFYPVDIRGLITQESMIALFEQVTRTNRTRFIYSNEFGDVPMLMVAAPLYTHGQLSQIILLQTQMGEAFLQNVTKPLHVEASLLSLDGRVMATSSDAATEIRLNPAQMSHISAGRPLFINHESPRGTERHLFSMIPLGNKDMVMLSLQASLKEKTAIQNATILQMIAIMVIVVITGSLFFLRRVNVVTRPARDLRTATEALARGNMGYRIRNVSNDELGQIASSFNVMAAQIEHTLTEQASQQVANAIAHEENKARQLLEKKEREREQISEELGIIQREMKALYQLNQAMTDSIQLKVLFDRILHTLNEIMECDHIVLLSYNTAENLLEVERASGLDNETLREVRFTLNEGITGEAASSQKLIYVANLDKDNRNLSYHGQVATRGCMISAPLLVKRRLIGVINLHKNQAGAFSASEQKLIQAIANQTAIAIDNARLIEKSREHGSIDELTGLSNRIHFQEILKRELAHARRFSSNFSIIMCDIDHFKQFKDALGTLDADALLRKVGQMLLKNTRGIDLVSRFGNDQFIILLPKTSKQGALATAEKLRKALNTTDSLQKGLGDEPMAVTVAFGVTEFPSDSKNIYELMDFADRALYAAKKCGGNCSMAWEGPAAGTK